MSKQWRCYKITSNKDVICDINFGPAPEFVWYSDDEVSPPSTVICSIGSVMRNERPLPTRTRDDARTEAERVTHKGGLDWTECSFAEAIEWAAQRKVADRQQEGPDYNALVAVFEDGSAIAVRSEYVYYSEETGGEQLPPTFWKGI